MNYLPDPEFSKLIIAPSPTLSVVVPAHNEENNILPLLHRLYKTLQILDESFEIIFVDDGSADNTVLKIKECMADFPEVKLIRLSRNFGKEAALNAGMQHAQGKAIIQIDADLQHPTELISDFVQHWHNGIDIVYGARRSRNSDGLVRRSLTKAFYKVFSHLSDVKLMEGLGDFLLMDRKVVEAMKQLNERERFTKGLYAWVGFSRIAVPFDVVHRETGASKFGLMKLFSFGVSAITSFGSIPLKIWTYLGLALAVPSLAYGLYTIFKTLIFGVDVPGYASLMVAVCFFSGIQLIGLGIIGEYLGRVSAEVKQRPIFLVKEKLGFNEMNGIPTEVENSIAEKTK